MANFLYQILTVKGFKIIYSYSTEKALKLIGELLPSYILTTNSVIFNITCTCRSGGKLAPSTLSAWLHHPVKSFRELCYGRESTDSSAYAALATDIFSSPETVAAYVERLDRATLAFAIDAAHVIDVVPPRKGSEYVILDNACGTGAAVEWIVNEFDKPGVSLVITATDHSAVMMN